jgi:hypothetical protein
MKLTPRYAYLLQYKEKGIKDRREKLTKHLSTKLTGITESSGLNFDKNTIEDSL